MKKKTGKIKAVLIIIPLLTIFIVSALIASFYHQTIGGNIEDYCTENSFRSADSFVIETSNDINGYIFIVSKNGNESKGQELFVLREKSFGVIKNTKRYVEEYHSSPQANLKVGTYNFKPIVKDERANTNYLVFYSDNYIGAESGRYITKYNENGKDIKTEVSYSVIPNQPFICISAPLKPFEEVVNAHFENSELERVFTY